MMKSKNNATIVTRIIAIAVILSVLFSSLNPVNAKADETEVKFHDVVVDVTYNQTEARKLFTIINEFRQSEDAWFWTSDDDDADDTDKYYPQGLQDFKYDYALEKVAMQRAAEIAIRFEHFRPQGNSPDYACTDLGFPGRILLAENIAVGRSSAEAAMMAFREDKYKASGQPHRRTMLAKYTAIGIGYVKLNGVDYWVIDFGMATDEPESEPFNDTVELTIPMKDNYVKSVSAYVDFTVTEGETVSLDRIIPTFQPTSGFWKTKTRGIPVKNPLTFISADNEYISINENEIIGLKPGKGIITASLFDREFTIEISVEAKPEPVVPTPDPTPIPVNVIVVPYNPEDDIIPTENPTETVTHKTPVSSAAVTVDIPENTQNDAQNDTENENSDQTENAENPSQPEISEIPDQTETHDQTDVLETPDNTDVNELPENSDQNTQSPDNTTPQPADTTSQSDNNTATDTAENTDNTPAVPTDTTNTPSNTVPSNDTPSHTVPSTTTPSYTIPSSTIPSSTIPSYTVPSNDTSSTYVPSTTVPAYTGSNTTSNSGNALTNNSNVKTNDNSNSAAAKNSEDKKTSESTQNNEPKTSVKTNTDGSVTETIYTIGKNHIDIAVRNTSEDNTSVSAVNYAGTTGNKITITSAETTEKTFTISKYIKVGKKKYYITTIGRQILKGNTTVTKLKIGSKVATIEANAFKGNKKIKTVEITAKNLMTIETGAFSKLRSKVKFIIKGSSEDCERVKQLIIDSGVSKKARFEFKIS